MSREDFVLSGTVCPSDLNGRQSGNGNVGSDNNRGQIVMIVQYNASGHQNHSSEILSLSYFS